MHYNATYSDFNLFLKKIVKKPVNFLNYMYDIFFYFKLGKTRCCEVFADVNAIYFTTLRWIMNVCSGFETLSLRRAGRSMQPNVPLWVGHFQPIANVYAISNFLPSSFVLDNFFWYQIVRNQLLYRNVYFKSRIF